MSFVHKTLCSTLPEDNKTYKDLYYRYFGTSSDCVDMAILVGAIQQSFVEFIKFYAPELLPPPDTKLPLSTVSKLYWLVFQYLSVHVFVNTDKSRIDLTIKDALELF